MDIMISCAKPSTQPILYLGRGETIEEETIAILFICSSAQFLPKQFDWRKKKQQQKQTQQQF